MVNYNDCKDIPDWEFIMQSIANAYFSGLSFKELWNSVNITENREDFDVAVETAIKLNEITKGTK
jgi:hypothetical protein